MRKLTFTIASILFALLPVYAVKKIEANPINIAAMLTEEVDTNGIASTCEYYGYVAQPSQDGYDVYKHPNGSIIRYTFTKAENGKEYPTIEVKSKASTKDKDQILQNLNFKKVGNAYMRKSISHQTRCSSSEHGFLCFSNQPKDKK